MTKDEVIELAKQAGFADGVAEIVGLYGFMKFANLVAEREREECAKLCEKIGDQDCGNHAWDAAAAVRARGTDPAASAMRDFFRNGVGVIPAD